MLDLWEVQTWPDHGRRCICKLDQRLVRRRWPASSSTPCGHKIGRAGAQGTFEDCPAFGQRISIDCSSPPFALCEGCAMTKPKNILPPLLVNPIEGVIPGMITAGYPLQGFHRRSMETSYYPKTTY